MKKIIPLLTFIVGCELIGLVSTPLTIQAISTWYTTLQKPFFTPPNWIFGPVWIVLYFLMGVAAYLVWERGDKKKSVQYALRLFYIQLFFNFLWSILFFGLRSPLFALVDIILLGGSVLLVIKNFYAISKTASYLLIPYILWISFAMLLNIAIVILN